MNSRYFIIFALNIILILNVKAQDQSINESIRKLTELLPQINAPEGSPGIYCKTLLPAYYQGRNFQPVWQKKSQAEALVASVKLAEDEGLSPNDYHYGFLLSKMKNYEPDDAELEVYLTDAFLLYASHLIGGKVNAQSLGPQWKGTAKEVNLMALLDSAISNNSTSETLLSLTPTYKTYTRLKKTLATYNVLAYDGGWSPIAAGETLKPGMTDPRIKSLRLRLTYSGDVSMKSSTSELYDEELEKAVRKFQLCHGLEPDGK